MMDRGARQPASERKRMRQMELLANLARRISYLDDPHALANEIVQRLNTDFGFERVALYLVHDHSLILRAAAGAFVGNAAPAQRLPLGVGIAGRAAQNGRTYRTNDALRDEHFRPPSDTHPAAGVATPLLLGANTIGVLTVESDRPHAFDDTDVGTLEFIADLLATAWQSSQLFEDLRRRERLANALRRVGAAVTASLELDYVLDRICDEVCEVFAVEGAIVWLLQSGELRAAAAHGPISERIVGQRIALDDRASLAARAARERRSIFVNEVQASSEGHPYLKQLTGAQAFLAMPIVKSEQCLGVLVILDLQNPQRFGHDDVIAAELLGDQLAVALDNARLYEESRRYAQQQEALVRLSADLAATLDEAEICRRVVSGLSQTLGYAYVGFFLVDEATGDRVLQAWVGWRGVPQNWRLPPGQGISERALLDGQLHYTPDVTREPAYVPGLGAGAEVDVPVRIGEKVAGVLVVESEQPGAFGPGDFKVLTAVADQAGLALQNARLHAEVTALAVTDGLTGLANRRAFDRALTLEVARAKRYGHTLSLIMADVDDFKVYNDTYGHPAGDERLKEIAALLKDDVRDPDLAARYGGEEFTLILPHTDKQGAIRLAERIRARAEAAIGDRAKRNGAGPQPGCTLTLGVASYPEDAATAEELLRAADDAELAAKHAGKNRVRAAPSAQGTLARSS